MISLFNPESSSLVRRPESCEVKKKKRSNAVMDVSKSD